jgi:hypothetical protein
MAPPSALAPARVSRRHVAALLRTGVHPRQAFGRSRRASRLRHAGLPRARHARDRKSPSRSRRVQLGVVPIAPGWSGEPDGCAEGPHGEADFHDRAVSGLVCKNAVGASDGEEAAASDHSAESYNDRSPHGGSSTRFLPGRPGGRCSVTAGTPLVGAGRRVEGYVTTATDASRQLSACVFGSRRDSVQPRSGRGANAKSLDRGASSHSLSRLPRCRGRSYPAGISGPCNAAGAKVFRRGRGAQAALA